MAAIIADEMTDIGSHSASILLALVAEMTLEMNEGARLPNTSSKRRFMVSSFKRDSTRSAVVGSAMFHLLVFQVNLLRNFGALIEGIDVVINQFFIRRVKIKHTRHV